ncbi:MAG: helix-turn-helix transcriptional regulator, partial [Nakamurella sp.]
GFAGVVHAAGLLLDDGSRDLVLAAMEETARGNGAKNLLCSIISLRCQFDVQAGRIAVARARYHEMQEMMDLVGYPLDYPPLVAMGAAIRGWTANPPIDSADFIRGVAACERTGYGAGVEQWLRAWVANRIAAGEYTEAWTVARDIDIDTGAADGFLLADLIEIASRTGQPSRAQMLQNALATRGARMPTSTFAGLLCWADAFTGDDTDTAFRSAIHHFENANATLFTARAHLGLGEWLRRQRRRRQALTHLGTAAAIFADQGVAGWAARAERELAALGIAHQPTRSQYFDLTPQEATVARLAGEGATNGEIAERLYISPSTVDYHLRKVYRKFGVTSRRQLRTTLA